MTALAIGSSITVAVRDGGTVAIATNGGFGTVTSTPVGGAVVSASFGPEPARRVFGPFSEGASVTVSNNSCNAFDYDLQGAMGDYLGSFAWASLPDATLYTGYRARVTDVGVNLMVVSDGVRWAPNGMQLLSRSAVASSVTGTLSETALATITVPANLMGVNGGILIWPTFSYTNNANSKTIRTRFGGIGGTQYSINTVTTTASGSGLIKVRNRGAANSQVGGAGNSLGGMGTSAAVVVTSAVDTTQSADIVLTGTLGVTSDTITLETYDVWALA